MTRSAAQRSAVLQYRRMWRRLMAEADHLDTLGWAREAEDVRRLAAMANRAAWNEVTNREPVRR